MIFAFVMILMSVALPKFKQMQEKVDGVNLVSREILTGLPVIRAFRREDKEEERFDGVNRELTKTMLFTNRVMTLMMPGMMLIMYALTVAIVWVAAKKIDLGVMQVGSMTAFITYAMLIVMAFLMLTMMSVMLPRAGVAADRIDEVIGILNGTTNYMMTKMFFEGADYAEVLKEAQDKGYAERNPEADVEGHDACRKIAILTSLISGQHVDFEKIHTEGITKITTEDMKYAKKLNMAIKLLASSKRVGDTFSVLVAPMLLSEEHPLCNVNDVFNAVFVRGNMLGDAMFYGSGAGKLPTASAVVADVVDAAKHLHRNVVTRWDAGELELIPNAEAEHRFFVRVQGRSEAQKEQIREAFGSVEIVETEGLEDEFGFITEVMTEGTYSKKAEAFPEIIHMIRLAD